MKIKIKLLKLMFSYFSKENSKVKQLKIYILYRVQDAFKFFEKKSVKKTINKLQTITLVIVQLNALFISIILSRLQANGPIKKIYITINVYVETS